MRSFCQQQFSFKSFCHVRVGFFSFVSPGVYSNNFDYRIFQRSEYLYIDSIYLVPSGQQRLGMEAAQAAQLQLSGAAEPTFKQLGSSSSKATRVARSDSSSLKRLEQLEATQTIRTNSKRFFFIYRSFIYRSESIFFFNCHSFRERLFYCIILNQYLTNLYSIIQFNMHLFNLIYCI